MFAVGSSAKLLKFHINVWRVKYITPPDFRALLTKRTSGVLGQTLPPLYLKNTMRPTRDQHGAYNRENTVSGGRKPPNKSSSKKNLGLNENAISYVEDKLMLNEADEEAGFLLTTKIVNSIRSVYPRINFIAHTIAQGKGNILELLFGSTVTDFDHMPFNLEDCSKETDGEIVNVYIQGFRKIKDGQDGTKVYVSLARVSSDKPARPSMFVWEGENRCLGLFIESFDFPTGWSIYELFRCMIARLNGRI